MKRKHAVSVAALRKNTEPAIKKIPSPDWEPQFDACSAEQERLALQFCLEIAGERGGPGQLPDPVRLLEMAEALYHAERDDHLSEVAA